MRHEKMTGRREGWKSRVKAKAQLLTLQEMIAEFDRLMETGDLDAEHHPADKLGEKIMCPKTWAPKKPCGGKPK